MQWAVVVSMAMEVILTFAASHVGGKAKGLSKINLTTIKRFRGVLYEETSREYRFSCIA
jgi:hypothetical protein